MSEYFKEKNPANVLYKDSKNIKLTSTDFKGMKKCFDDISISFDDYDIILLGSGGVSESFKRGFESIGKNVITVSRNSDINYSNLDGFKKKQSIIFNCTPLGTTGKYENESPLSLFDKDDIVFDCVYNPIETKFLKTAKDFGCLTVSGIDMLVNQAIYSLEYFLNVELDFQELKKIMKASL